jgi:hypothetical protein
MTSAAIRPGEMAGGKEPIEVKFRLFDGTDIGPSKYDPSTTVAALKEFVLSRWPQGETSRPIDSSPSLLLYASACRILTHNTFRAASCFGGLLVLAAPLSLILCLDLVKKKPMPRR